jgi:hypothetical protein
MKLKNIIRTGLETCHDFYGKEIFCADAGQDATFRIGQAWPEPRLAAVSEDLVRDELTGLLWTRKANFFDFPLTWDQALEEIRAMNREGFAGFSDWRLPNRREMRSIISHGHIKPALPPDHPFTDVFIGWYWTSTTSAMAPDHAWYVHLEGARMFYGGKGQRYLAWPVRGDSSHIPRTGQRACFDERGHIVPCPDSGQDAEFNMGQPWPESRFSRQGNEILDHLTNLVWLDPGEIKTGPLNWEQALEAVLNIRGKKWRLPNINELESLVDASAHSPALLRGHPFTGLNDGYWSSTTSIFEPDWAYVLYLNKGAVGVGFKPGPEFFVWPARDFIL